LHKTAQSGKQYNTKERYVFRDFMIERIKDHEPEFFRKNLQNLQGKPRRFLRRHQLRLSQRLQHMYRGKDQRRSQLRNLLHGYGLRNLQAEDHLIFRKNT
jgi:hypothetical protein